MRVRESDETGDHSDQGAEQRQFELELIEAACRAVGNGRGPIARIRVCLPIRVQREPDLSLEQIVDRWGAWFGVTARVEDGMNMSVVSISSDKPADDQ